MDFIKNKKKNIKLIQIINNIHNRTKNIINKFVF